MPNSFFKFKQFTIYHDKCAMKVGTDGVLLGAWATVSDSRRSILDVGTGSGLIALMLAQRNSAAQILGIDIDANAVLQASENFENSPFSNRLRAEQTSFEEWIKSETEKVDLIVSNPPFFSDSLQSPNKKRTLARHDTSLLIKSLFEFSKMKLSENGLLSLILPYSQKQVCEQFARDNKWFLSRCTTVFPKPDSQPKRLLLEFSKNLVPQPQINEIVIEEARHKYTSDYIELTKDFYLKM